VIGYSRSNAPGGTRQSFLSFIPESRQRMVEYSGPVSKATFAALSAENAYCHVVGSPPSAGGGRGAGRVVGLRTTAPTRPRGADSYAQALGPGDALFSPTDGRLRVAVADSSSRSRGQLRNSPAARYRPVGYPRVFEALRCRSASMPQPDPSVSGVSRPHTAQIRKRAGGRRAGLYAVALLRALRGRGARNAFRPGYGPIHRLCRHRRLCPIAPTAVNEARTCR